MTVSIRMAAVVVALASAQAQPPSTDRAGERASPPRVREAIFEVLSRARACAEAQDFECARADVEDVRARADLTAYERAVTAQFSAFVNYEQGREAAALADYETLLGQPGLPERLVRDTLYTVSQLHLQAQDPEAALASLDRWFALTGNPGAEAHLLRAQIHYGLEQWPEGAEAIDAAMRAAQRTGESVPEGWHQLKAVFAHELGGCERAFDTLETLMTRWPKPDYYVQAAGCAGQLGETERQLELMDVAAAAGLLDGAASLVHARMLLGAERFDDARA